MASRKANKERTRQKLIDATLKVLYKHGRSALTTGRIAEAAGVAQPTFYVHFKDMEDALTQAADAVAARLLTRLKDYRTDLKVGAPVDMVRGTYGATVKALVREPKMAELFLRHRRDASSPLGKKWRSITDRARDDLHRDLERMGLGQVYPDLAIYSELIVGMVLALVEGVIDKRVSDLDLALDELAHMTVSGLGAAYQRHAGKPPDPSSDAYELVSGSQPLDEANA